MCRREEYNADLRKNSNVLNELAVVDGLVLHGERIVVPQTLREAMVTIAHEGHQGIVRTKRDMSRNARIGENGRNGN